MSLGSISVAMEPIRILPFVRTLSALAGTGLQPCLMRADADITTWGKELDLIVLPSKLQATLSVLSGLGWEIGNTGFFDPSRRHLLLWSDDRFLRIDLYSQIVSNGLEYIDADRYFAGATLQGDVYVPCAGIWLLHVVVNTILEKRCLREEYRLRIANVLQKRDALQQAVADASHLGLSYLFESDPDFNFLFDEIQISGLRVGVRKALLKARTSNKVRIAWRWTMQTIGKKLALRPGFSIALNWPGRRGENNIPIGFWRRY